MEKRFMSRLALLAFLCSGIMACASSTSTPAESSDPLLAEGRFLVQVHCGDCHGYRTEDQSRHAEAPVLRMLSRSYPVSSLEESLAEGIVVGHPDMPEYRFRPEDVEAIILYLESIQTR